MGTIEGAKRTKRVGQFVSLFGCLVVALSGFMYLWLVASSKEHERWVVFQLVGIGVFFLGWLLQRSAKSA